MKRALALPEGQRIRSVDEAFAGLAGDDALDGRIASWYAGSRVFDVAARLSMFDETPDALRARQDALLDLGFALDAERRALKDRRDAAAGRGAAAAARVEEGGDRRGRAPGGPGRERLAARDASAACAATRRARPFTPTPHTTLAGVVEKHTGEDPFDLPLRVREAYAAKRFGRWARPGARPGAGGASHRLRHDGRELGQPDHRRRGPPASA